MNPTVKNPITARAGRAIAAFALTLALVPVCTAQIRALNYDTPSYIELEASEIRAHEGTTKVTINLFRTGEFRVITKVAYVTVGQSATEGRDFRSAGGTVTFKPGEGMKTITLDLLPDDEVEEDETFDLKLSAAGEMTIVSRDTATILIQDAPPAIPDAPTLTIAAVDGGAIRLAWEGHPNASLERNTDPERAAWEPVRCAVQIAGTKCEVTEPAGGNLYFYRLRTP